MSETLLARAPIEPGQINADHVWPDRSARFYARALDISDYGAAVARVMSGQGAEKVAPPESLLDIGAGAGHPVREWLPPASPWTALEPNRYLRARLGRLARTQARPLAAHDGLWQDLAGLAVAPHAMAWAANIAATQTHPQALLSLMRSHARERVVWLVPAQRGPKRWCLAGALPPALHGESERPGVELVLEALGRSHAPHRIHVAHWQFAARFASLALATEYCVGQVAHQSGASRHAAIAEHLAATAHRLPDGVVELRAPKHSALLIWDV